MKTVLRYLFDSICLFLAAAGLLAVLVASFMISALVVAWDQDSRLQHEDWRMMATAAQWLVGSSLLVAGIWWLRYRTGAREKGDRSFQIIPASGRIDRITLASFEIGFVVFVGVWLWGVVHAPPIIKVPIVAAWIAGAFLGLHAHILLHELGHLSAARILGMQMRKIQVGIGPLLWSLNSPNGLIWEWRLSPHGGFMYASPRTTKNFRVRQFIFVLGGPLVDALVLWTTYQAILFFFGGLVAAVNQSAVGLITTILFWCVAISAIGGLFPLKLWLGKQTLWTDGYWFLRLATTSRARLASLAFNPDWKRALELFQSDLPDSLNPSPSVQVDHNPNVVQIFQEQRERLASQLLPKTER